MDALDDVIAQMYAADLPLLPAGHPKLDGKHHRWGRDRKAWYVLREFVSRQGRRIVVGAFGRWQGMDPCSIKVKADFGGVDQDELDRLRRAQASAEVREREKRQARTRYAALRAIQQWGAARARLAEGEANAYLQKKRLQWENGLRQFTEGTLVVPMVRYDVTEVQDADPAYTGPRRLAGLQKIDEDGKKRFNRGTDPIGAACRFGKPKDGDLIMIGEGLATVLSVRQALERVYPAYVAFTAGNLLPVARIIRGLYPKSPILFLADDDAYLEAQLNKRLRDEYGAPALYKVLDSEREFKGKHGETRVRADVHDDPAADGAAILTAGITVDGRLRTVILRNAGRTAARAAAAEISNAWVTWPRFATRELAIDPEAARLTDFNDLHATEGLPAVVDQVGEAIRAIEEAHALAQALRDGTANASQADAGAGGGKGPADDVDWQLHGSLLKRFTLIERSDTAYDAERGYLWRVSHMRLTYGGGPVARWLGAASRRSVDLSQVVFDPTSESDPATTVNMFRGLEMKPAAGSCTRILALLHYLCGEDPEDTEAPITSWVLKWCAYPVQNIGAKMASAIVMYGPEGTGKNLFWGVMRQIFGRYAALITQAELEDKHNTWLSAKLFLIANEVITKSEMSHHVGRLKNLVTEDEVYINPKMVDQRYERNHVNLVFLSNEFQPLKISPGDRRYMVIRTPRERPEEFYREVSAERRAGGVAAFMRYLLELDLAGFNPHTKPILTDAKRDLIEIGMLPSQLFWQDMKDQLIPLPYCPALSDDVYRAYAIWCVRRGHKMPEAQNRFTPAFMSMNGVRRVRLRGVEPEPQPGLVMVDGEEPRKRVIFIMGEACMEPDKERQRVQRGVVEFRRALKAYHLEDSQQAFGGYRARAERPEEAL